MAEGDFDFEALRLALLDPAGTQKSIEWNEMEQNEINRKLQKKKRWRQSGVARIFQQGGGGAKRGSEATERGRVVGGGCPTVGRFFFEILCIKGAFFEH